MADLEGCDRNLIPVLKKQQNLKDDSCEEQILLLLFVFRYMKTTDLATVISCMWEMREMHTKF